MPGVHGAISLPPRTLLARSAPPSVPDAEAEAGARTLAALFEQFRIDARTVEYVRGPIAVNHTIGLGQKSSLTHLVALAGNIAYALPGARVSAGNGGRGVVVEVPSARRSQVLLGDVLEASDAGGGGPLAVVLGADNRGGPVALDITGLPHLLMAGTTGSGKSTCLHAIVLSVLMRATPDQLRMVLIDTRSLELGRYEGVEHLIMRVVTDSERAAQALAWAVREAEMRLDDLAAAKTRHVEDFNAAVRAGHIKTPLGSDTMLTPYPLLLIAIDDLADVLRSPQRREVEDALLQIGTRGRAVGIHVVAGTRHPQAFALPPKVAATMPARLSFAATEGPGPTRDLRVGTAELSRLGAAKVQVWCADVGEQEIDAVAAHWRT